MSDENGIANDIAAALDSYEGGQEEVVVDDTGDTGDGSELETATGEEGAEGELDVQSDDEEGGDATDPRDAEIQALKDDLRKANQTISDIATGKTGAEEKSGGIDSSHQPTTVSWEQVEFAGEDFDPETMNAETMNGMLNKLGETLLSKVTAAAENGMMLKLPGIVQNSVKIQNAIAKATKDFYASNEDLKPFSKVVATVAAELGSEHTDWDMNTLFTKAGEEARKRLNLVAKPGKTNSNKGRGGGLTGVGSQNRQQQGKQPLTGEAKQIADMLRVVES